MSRRFGIVGCGMIAKFHARAIADLEGCAASCLLQSHGSEGRSLGRRIRLRSGYRFATNAHRATTLDIITICTASGAHCEPTIAAAEAGKHVIVEKPLDVTRERCQAMIDACDSGWCQAGYHLPVAISSRQLANETGCRTRPIWKAGLGGRLRKMVPYPRVLRQRRLARHLETGRWGTL